MKYAAGIVNTAVNSRIGQGEGITVTDTDRKRGRIINDYQNNQRDDNSLIKAMDAVFSRKEDKAHVLSVIAKNSWA